MKKSIAIALVFMLAFSLVPSVFADDTGAEDVLIAAAPLNAQDTCPDGIDGWIKVDNVPDEIKTIYSLFYGGVQHGTATTNDPSKGLVSVLLDSGWKADLCVKGGTSVVFAYAVESGGDSGTATTGGGGSIAAVSHFSYRLIPPVQNPGQWCSPGFWKNNHGAWPSPYTPDTTDSATGKKFGYILSNPKIYAKTGDFERIADILSTAHPDVNFLGERVADSCPLSADEANK